MKTGMNSILNELQLTPDSCKQICNKIEISQTHTDSLCFNPYPSFQDANLRIMFYSNGLSSIRIETQSGFM